MSFYKELSDIQTSEQFLIDYRQGTKHQISSLELRIKEGYDKHGIIFTSEADTLNTRIINITEKLKDKRKALSARKKKLMCTEEGRAHQLLMRTESRKVTKVTRKTKRK